MSDQNKNIKKRKRTFKDEQLKQKEMLKQLIAINDTKSNTIEQSTVNDNYRDAFVNLYDDYQKNKKDEEDEYDEVYDDDNKLNKLTDEFETLATREIEAIDKKTNNFYSSNKTSHVIKEQNKVLQKSLQQSKKILDELKKIKIKQENRILNESKLSTNINNQISTEKQTNSNLQKKKNFNKKNNEDKYNDFSELLEDNILNVKRSDLLFDTKKVKVKNEHDLSKEEIKKQMPNIEIKSSNASRKKIQRELEQNVFMQNFTASENKSNEDSLDKYDKFKVSSFEEGLKSSKSNLPNSNDFIDINDTSNYNNINSDKNQVFDDNLEKLRRQSYELVKDDDMSDAQLQREMDNISKQRVVRNIEDQKESLEQVLGRIGVKPRKNSNWGTNSSAMSEQDIETQIAEISKEKIIRNNVSQRDTLESLLEKVGKSPRSSYGTGSKYEKNNYDDFDDSKFAIGDSNYVPKNKKDLNEHNEIKNEFAIGGADDIKLPMKKDGSIDYERASQIIKKTGINETPTTKNDTSSNSNNLGEFAKFQSGDININVKKIDLAVPINGEAGIGIDPEDAHRLMQKSRSINSDLMDIHEVRQRTQSNMSGPNKSTYERDSIDYNNNNNSLLNEEMKELLIEFNEPKSNSNNKEEINDIEQYANRKPQIHKEKLPQKIDDKKNNLFKRKKSKSFITKQKRVKENLLNFDLDEHRKELNSRIKEKPKKEFKVIDEKNVSINTNPKIDDKEFEYFANALKGEGNYTNQTSGSDSMSLDQYGERREFVHKKPKIEKQESVDYQNPYKVQNIPNRAVNNSSQSISDPINHNQGNKKQNSTFKLFKLNKSNEKKVNSSHLSQQQKYVEAGNDESKEYSRRDLSNKVSKIKKGMSSVEQKKYQFENEPQKFKRERREINISANSDNNKINNIQNKESLENSDGSFDGGVRGFNHNKPVKHKNQNFSFEEQIKMNLFKGRDTLLTDEEEKQRNIAAEEKRYHLRVEKQKDILHLRDVVNKGR